MDIIEEYEYMRQYLQEKKISSVSWLRSEDNLADEFTNELSRENENLRDFYFCMEALNFLSIRITL